MRGLTVVRRLATSTVGLILGTILVGLGGVHLVVPDPAWLAVFAGIVLVGLGILLVSGRYAWRTVSHRG